MSTAQSNTEKKNDKKNPLDGIGTLFAAIGYSFLILLGLVSCLGDGGEDDNSSEEDVTFTTKETPEWTTTEEAPEWPTTEEAPEPFITKEAPVLSTSPANLAEGVNAEYAPQEWFDQEVYRANNCASQNLAYGGIPMCAIRGVDTENGGTMLVGYIDQDEAGVQDHFALKQRRDMMVRSFADLVLLSQSEGDPRVQHVTDVRIIASGGKGLGSGWQGEAPVR